MSQTIIECIPDVMRLLDTFYPGATTAIFYMRDGFCFFDVYYKESYEVQYVITDDAEKTKELNSHLELADEMFLNGKPTLYYFIQ